MASDKQRSGCTDDVISCNAGGEIGAASNVVVASTVFIFQCWAVGK